ncbi:hypothetical protein PYCC9005_005652 [Savitreella phatthalungensis]
MAPRLLAVGIVVALITSFVQSLGLTLQRKAHVSQGDQTWTWRTGFIIFILANLFGSTVQIAALPLAILAPLHAVGLVYNAILATWMLGEPFTYLAWAGTLLVAVGASLIAVFGAIEEPTHSLEQLLHLFVGPGFLTWMSFQAVLILAIVAGVSFVSRTAHGKTEHSRRAQGAALGILAGILASHCLLLAKLTVELLVKTFGEGDNQFKSVKAFVIPAVFVSGALAQLYYLNRGLRMCSTSILYPLNFSIYNITTIVDGIVYYGEGKQLNGLHIGLIVLGIALLLTGVAGLSWKLTHSAHEGVHDTCDSSDDEDDIAAGLQLSIPGLYDLPAPAWHSPKSPRSHRRQSSADPWDRMGHSGRRVRSGGSREESVSPPDRRSPSPTEASTRGRRVRQNSDPHLGVATERTGLLARDSLVRHSIAAPSRRAAQPPPDNTPIRHLKGVWQRLVSGQQVHLEEEENEDGAGQERQSTSR